MLNLTNLANLMDVLLHKVLALLLLNTALGVAIHVDFMGFMEGYAVI